MAYDLRTYTQKLAEIGGSDGNNKEFEQAFSDLAHAYIRESAPTLEQYELGFQLLERSDDGQRAVGITGFKIGNELIYSPVFWLRGRIKGHELLFLQRHKLFVPLKEAWLNYLMNRKQQRVGDAVARNPRLLGLRQPDLPRMTRSPHKYAAFEDLLRPQIEGFDAAGALTDMQRPRQKNAQALLPTALRLLGPAGIVAFNKIAEAAPKIAELAYDVHGEDLLDALSAAARASGHKILSTDIRQQRLQPRTVKVPDTPGADGHFMSKEVLGDLRSKCAAAVRVITYSGVTTEIDEAIPDADRDALIRNNYLVQDQRPDDAVSRAYTLPSRASFKNPTESGLYDVITRFDGLQRMLVLRTPWSPTGRSVKWLLVEADADGNSVRRYCFRDAADIWVMRQYSNDDYQSFVKKLPRVTTGLDGLDDENYDTCCVLLSAGVSPILASCPFRTEERISGQDRLTYEIRTRYDSSTPDCSISRLGLVVDNNDTTHFRAFNGKLFVPNNAHVLRCARSYSYEFELGRPEDVTSTLESGLNKLAVYRNGPDVHIKTAAGSVGPIGPLDAMRQLIEGHGLREPAALELLRQADVNGVSRTLIKYADSYAPPYLVNSAQYGPSQDLPNLIGAQQIRGGESVLSREPEAMHSSVAIPREPMPYQQPYHSVGSDDLNIAQQAAQSGQQDVFDASVLTTMLRNMRDDQLIDRFIPALARALDVTGQLLFQFYWHQDDFSERYGDKDMPDLEDSLRNLFEGLGDIVLKLKQKTVTAYPESQDMDVSLDDLAGAS